MQIYDCFIFYKELDILEIRLNELYPVVDRFVLVEARKTHTGQPKTLFYDDNKARYARFADKIIHVIVDDIPADRAKGVEASYYHRDRINDGLKGANPDDLIMVSDADEIPSAESIRRIVETGMYRDAIIYYEMPVYHFKLNWRVHRKKSQFNTKIIERRYFRGAQHLRFSRAVISRSLPAPIEKLLWQARTAVGFGHVLERRVIEGQGWHFSFMFDKSGIREKVRAYGHFDRETGDSLSDQALETKFLEQRSMWGDRISPESLDGLPAHVRANPERFAHLLGG